MIALGEATKACGVCKRDLPLSEYHANPATRDGSQPACKECINERARRWRRDNRERMSATSRRWYQARREERIEANRRWREQNPDKSRVASKAAGRRRRYGRDSASVGYAQVVLADPCSYCGGRSQQVDHIEASASGGENHWTNLTGACADCNLAKRDHPLLHFLAVRRIKEAR